MADDLAERRYERPAASIRRRRRRWVGTAVIVVLVAAGVPAAARFVHWRAGLHLFVPYPGFGVSIPVAVGTHEYFGETAVEADAAGQVEVNVKVSVTVTSIRPIVTLNTADAAVDVLRCALVSDGHGPVAEPPDNCSTLTPFTSGHVNLGFRRGDDDLVIRVTPRRAGTVRVTGVELGYRTGIRHGTQHVGGRLETTPEPS